jgi:mono/diheme cytochrome c family protein
MKRRRARHGAALALAAALAACGSHEFEPPDKGERVRGALAEYSPAMFDSIAWTSEDDRTTLGNEVYVEKCRNCHGPLGRGQTEYAREQGLDAPSLVEADWPLAIPDSLHKVIFVGHEKGMPIFGDGTMSPREIDAVAAYILDVLRPDVAGGPRR